MKFKEGTENKICLPQFSPAQVYCFLRWSWHLTGFGKVKDAKALMDEQTVLLLAPVAHFLGAESILEIIVEHVNENPSMAKVAAVESAGAEPKWEAPVFAALALVRWPRKSSHPKGFRGIRK
jgi:hypothetical protein